MSRTLIIIPTYNESATIEGVVSGVRSKAPSADVLIIDDASPDGTGAIADRLAAEHDQISVLHRPAKSGLGTAYITGFRHAIDKGYDTVVECDGDGSHQPEDLAALLEAVEGGADLALGSRWIEGGAIVGWPIHRQWISRTGTRVAQLCLGSRLRDLTSGYRAFRVAALSTFDLGRITTQGYGFQVEVAWRFEQAGRVIAEVPITFIERKGGTSKMSIGIILEALWMVLRLGLKRQRPLR